MSDTKTQNPLIGKKIVAVHLASDDKALRFDLEGGGSVIARADGDCCSRSWIESLDAPELLVEAQVVSVEALHLRNEDVRYGVVRHYGCKITTTRGRCVIDYRNESNGYYGGGCRGRETTSTAAFTARTSPTRNGG